MLPAYPLNHYQQLMLKFSELLPYNAVHVVDLKKELGINELQHGINHLIKTIGIGEPKITANKKYISFKPYKPIKLPQTNLVFNEHIQTEINYQFALSEFPLRFFYIQEKEKAYLSLTYNHWIADAYAISYFIKALFSFLNNEQINEIHLNKKPLELYYQKTYQHKTAWFRYFGLIKSFFTFATAFRTFIPCESNFNANISYHYFPKGTLSQLLNVCKTNNITLNDLFIAVLAQLFGRLTFNQRIKLKKKLFKPTRNKIIISSISNIRSYSKANLNNIFSVFLGFFYLSFKKPEASTLQELSKLIAKKTKRIKSKHVAVKQYLLFKTQLKIWDKKKGAKSKLRLFSKNTPITVGISNMNLNQKNNALSKQAKQYIRFSPTATTCPIVFNLTSFNDYLSLGLTYRQGCYNAQQIEEIKMLFIKAIEDITIYRSL